MTFSEIVESGAGTFCRAQMYEDAGIVLEENTPEEIAEAALELEGRVKGIWQTTDEDEVLQSRFWEIFRQSLRPGISQSLHGELRLRIGTEFLRQNKAWLE